MRTRRTTLQTTVITEHWVETDSLPQIGTVRLGNDSSGEYQNCWRSDQSESETESDIEGHDIPDDDIVPETSRGLQTGELSKVKSQGSNG